MPVRKSLVSRSLQTISLLMIVAIAGCGGSGGSSQPGAATPANSSLSEDLANRSITQIGVIQYEKRTGNNNAVLSNVGAQFYQYQQPLADTTLSAIAAEYSSLDSEFCKVWVSEAPDFNDVYRLPHPVTLETSSWISAGQVLSVLSPAGSEYELHAFVNHFSQGDWYTYGPQDARGSKNLVNHLPEGSYLSIPGDVFPEFEDTPIPDVDFVTNISVLNTAQSPEQNSGSAYAEIFTADSRITWSGSADNNAYAVFHVYATINFRDQPSEFFCHVKDDGEFALPQNVKDALAVAEFPLIELSGWRTRYDYRLKDDALIVVKSTTSRSTSPGFLLNGPSLWNW